ncbi:choice-of-anchor D domain-containing protein, partial [Thiorhodovibrio winogradskyi]
MSYLSITLRIFPVCLLCFSASWAQGVSTHNIPQELEFSAQQYKTPEISDRRIDADHFSYRMKHLTYLLAELNKKDTSEFDKLALSDADHPRANPFSDNLISVDQRILYLGNLFSQLINLQKRSREMDFEELSARLRVLDYKAHYYSPGAHTSSRLASAISPYSIQITPSTYDFGTIEVGGTTPPLTVTLSNNSLVPITLSDYYPRISISDGFEITQSTCNDIVAAGDSCEVNVIFEPVSVGDFDSYLSFRFDEINDFFFVDLSGKAESDDTYLIGLTPSTYDFGTIEVGGTTPPLTVTLSNNSLVPITLSDYYPRISISDGFEITQSTCNDFVAAGDSCEVNVIFEPVSVGDFDSYL